MRRIGSFGMALAPLVGSIALDASHHRVAPCGPADDAIFLLWCAGFFIAAALSAVRVAEQLVSRERRIAAASATLAAGVAWSAFRALALCSYAPLLVAAEAAIGGLLLFEIDFGAPAVDGQEVLPTDPVCAPRMDSLAFADLAAAATPELQ